MCEKEHKGEGEKKEKGRNSCQNGLGMVVGRQLFISFPRQPFSDPSLRSRCSTASEKTFPSDCVAFAIEAGRTAERCRACEKEEEMSESEKFPFSKPHTHNSNQMMNTGTRIQESRCESESHHWPEEEGRRRESEISSLF